MQVLRQLAAFVYGLALLLFATTWLVGFMAARPVPLAYFNWFTTLGSHGNEVALAGVYIVHHFLPTIGLVAGGLLLVTAITATAFRRVVASSAIAGGCFGYALSFVVQSPEQLGGIGLMHIPSLPWWSLPATVAQPAALLLAYWLVTKHSQRPRVA